MAEQDPQHAELPHHRAAQYPVKRLGIIGPSDRSIRALESALADIGTRPSKSLLLTDVALNRHLLDDFDHVVIEFPATGPITTKVAGFLMDRLDSDHRFTCLILVPIDILELAWKKFGAKRAKILVDPESGEVFSGALQMIADAQAPGDGDFAERLSELAQMVEQIVRLLEAERMPGGEVIPAKAGEDTTTTDGVEPKESDRIRQIRQPLPDPRLVRKMVRVRNARNQFFEKGFFSDPAWDILLDLTAARAEHKRVSVTSLCIASGAPATTALRWINLMIERGLLLKVEDDVDRRRAFVSLSEPTADAMARYFEAVKDDLKWLD